MDSDLNILLNVLRNAINNDPNQFNRAKNDSMYDAFRPQVDALLNGMYQEVKTKAETECEGLEINIKNMKKWFESGSASDDDIQKYTSILNNISEVKVKMKTHDYLGYFNALQILNDIKNNEYDLQISIKNIQITIENNINASKNEIKRLNTILSEIPNKIKTLNESIRNINIMIKFIVNIIFILLCIIFLFCAPLFLIILIIAKFMGLFSVDRINSDDNNNDRNNIKKLENDINEFKSRICYLEDQIVLDEELLNNIPIVKFK